MEVRNLNSQVNLPRGQNWLHVIYRWRVWLHYINLLWLFITKVKIQLKDFLPENQNRHVKIIRIFYDSLTKCQH